jgi:hypothetical protein
MRMRRLALAGLAAFAVAAAPARADVYDDNPAAASRGAGDMVVLARGNDRAIYERHLQGGGWTAWTSIGGAANSGPGAAAYGDSIHVFVVGTDLAVYENVLRAGQWSGWTSLGGQATSAPSAIARRGTNYLDVVVRGTDNQMHLRTFEPGAGWYGWSALGGNLTSAPALVAQSATQLNIFARGTDGELVQKGWTGSGWVDWFGLGGGLTGAPSVTARENDQLDLFVRGGNRALYQRSWTIAGSWTPWYYLDATPLDSTPAAVSDTPGHLLLIARSGTSLAIKEWRAAAGWTGWSDWGPVAPPAPPPPPAAAPAPATPDGLATLRAGLRCTPPGGHLVVKVSVRHRAGMPRAHVRRVVFYVRNGPRRTDRKRPYRARIKLNRKAGTKVRVFARIYYTRGKGKKVHRKTVSRRFVMCK